MLAGNMRCHSRIWVRLDTCSAVVELYQSWCGPSKAVQGTLKRIYFDLTDRPLKFFTVRCVELVLTST